MLSRHSSQVCKAFIPTAPHSGPAGGGIPHRRRNLGQKGQSDVTHTCRCVLTKVAALDNVSTVCVCTNVYTHVSALHSTVCECAHVSACVHTRGVRSAFVLVCIGVCARVSAYGLVCMGVGVHVCQCAWEYVHM